MQYNYKAAKPEEFKEAYLAQIAKHHHIINQISDISKTPTPVDLDKAANAIMDAMEAAAEEIIPCKKPSPKARPWWNPQLKEAADRISRLYQEQIEYEINHSKRDRRLQKKITKAWNFFKRLVRFFKRK